MGVPGDRVVQGMVSVTSNFGLVTVMNGDVTDHDLFSGIKNGLHSWEGKVLSEHLFNPVLCRRVGLEHPLEGPYVVIPHHLEALGFWAGSFYILPELPIQFQAGFSFFPGGEDVVGPGEFRVGIHVPSISIEDDVRGLKGFDAGEEFPNHAVILEGPVDV